MSIWAGSVTSASVWGTKLRWRSSALNGRIRIQAQPWRSETPKQLSQSESHLDENRQEGFSDHIEMHRAYYGRIERGGKDFQISTLERIAAGLGEPVWALVREAEES